MEFLQVGARDVEIHKVQHLELKIDPSGSCYCPHCNAGPLNGAKGFSLTEEIQDPGIDDETVTVCSYCCEFLYLKMSEENKVTYSIPTKQQIYNFKSQIDPNLWNSLLKMKETLTKVMKISKFRGDSRYVGRTKKEIIQD